MAGSKEYAVLDLQDETDALGVDLQFQDFGETRTPTTGNVGSKHEQTITFTDFPDTPEEELEQEKLLGEEDEEKPTGLKSGTGFWTFDFYQQFFDVESKQVGDRILWSMVPKPGVSYLQSYIRPNPDLYGPFWICMTLTFTTAITGNLANYLGTRPEDTYVWRYDFHKVTLAATAIFSYAWLVPLAMWGVLVWRGSRAKISLLELLCIYGYSLAIFVPVSILWIVPQPWFKWCLAIVAPVLSGSVLVRTVWPSLSHDAKQVAIGIAVFILVLHATLALGFMLYFFAAPDKAASTIIPTEPIKEAGTKNDSSLAPAPAPAKQSVQDKNTSNNAADKGIVTVKKDGGVEKEKKDVSSQGDADPRDVEKKSVNVDESNKPLETSKNVEVAENLQGDADARDKEKKSDEVSKKPSEVPKGVLSEKPGTSGKTVNSEQIAKPEKGATSADNLKKKSDAVVADASKDEAILSHNT